MESFDPKSDFSSLPCDNKMDLQKTEIRQIPASVTTYAKNLRLVSKDFSFRSKFSHANQAYLVLRFLLTKVFDREGTLDDMEEILFYETVDYLNQYRNDTFFNNKRDWLSLKLLAEIKLSSPDWCNLRHFNAQVSIIRKQGVLLNPRAYLSLETKIRPERFIVRQNRLLRKDPPPLRYIGVGYRDKGTARVVSEDGSPNWTQVAMHASLDVTKLHTRDYSLPKSPLYEIRIRQ
jgi:hypothetical protein